ncbi:MULTISPECIES: DUF6287 domain-containing protein [Aerococcus]|uniref:DUF6287 domain-containing protein n=1 Tax=Aerococcus TaxID=1375 RepID=UPI000DCC04D4|nr:MULTISPECIES: DUF6287 domain-containing protein [Aerococcus]KAA9298843.1 hypothetical protein F6I08_04585 [Aerococcus tenax]MDK6689174.1 DUF6287 domain-containing protein [Aerococcus urinae]MDK8132989.1 DUF6287 domain-containing protein [Aerococcus urinae]MDK8484573.1 DUF6287 domain-containing protein [Aerococcus urinae]MDL5179420.1 DUF6287 domain-containing protein [Aerococcus tenax]
MNKANHKLLSLTALLALFLVGCQNNTESSTANSQSQASVSSEASSSKEESKAKESSKEESKAKEKEASKEEKEENSTKEEKAESESRAKETESESSANESSVPTIAGDLARTTSQQALDIDQIQQGDLSTLVGTWRNGRGQEFVFYEDGRVDPGSYLNLDNFKREDQFLVADLRSNGGVGGAALYIIPAGVEVYTPIDHLVDASDKSRDRLLGGHTYDMIEYPEEFFYRVD